MKKYFYILGILLFAFGCDRTGRQLDHVELLLNEMPDSAFVILRTINVHSPKDKARYSLLLSAALDKNYYDVESDSLIIESVNYYSQKPGKYRYMSNYYHGIALKNMLEYQSAIVAFEKAFNEAHHNGDYLYSGLAARNKAGIFNVIGNNAASIECYKEAISSFRNISDKRYLHYAMQGLAVDYVNSHELDSAMVIIDSLKQLSINPALLDRVLLLEAAINGEKNDNPQHVINLYNRISKEFFDVLDYGYLANAYQEVGKIDSADFFIHAGYAIADNVEKRASVDYMVSKIMNRRGNLGQAYRLVDKTMQVQDSVTRVRLQESASAAQRDYYKQELLLQQQQAMARITRNQLVIVIILLCLTIISSTFVVASRKKDERYRDILASMNSNEDTIARLTKDNADLLGSLLSEKLLSLDQLSCEYCSADTERAKDAIYKRYKAIVREMRDNPALFEDIENSLNRYCNNVVERFKAQFPQIQGEKLQMVVVFFTGIPYKTAQLFFKNHSSDSLKTARNRFKRMIVESNAEDAQLFIDILEMKKGGRRMKQKEDC